MNIKRWYGGRVSTRANTDFDIAMSSVNLETPDGKGFESRDAAHVALQKMILDEMLQMADNAYCLARLVKILRQLMDNPTHNQAEEDGLRFSIWPVDRVQFTNRDESGKLKSDAAAVVFNVSDLSAAQRAGLQIIANGVTPLRVTLDSLKRRGFVKYVNDEGYVLTESGQAALAVVTAAELSEAARTCLLEEGSVGTMQTLEALERRGLLTLGRTQEEPFALTDAGRRVVAVLPKG